MSDMKGRFAELIAGHVEWMRVRNYSDVTATERGLLLGEFVRWAVERSVNAPEEVTKPVLERYARWLYHYRKKNGKPLGAGTRAQRIIALRMFFKWLCREDHLPSNPASELETPRRERRLPKAVLSASEAERVLAVPDIATPEGLRDRAILEVLYSTGMRRRELAGLMIHDVDTERGTVMIRQGKGKKDRLIPVGERALAWVARYVSEVRPDAAGAREGEPLFLDASGAAIDPDWLTSRVSDLVETADLGKQGSCHMFRHTCATLMLENGADVRFIQQQLGHAELSSTQIYTHVSVRLLKEIHTRTHPGATLERPVRPGDNERASLAES
ncbi:MAG: hypothetical protein RJA21_1988 [Gemmatimonadota bacterium]|jgi:integrase/recombinase XerD